MSGPGRPSNFGELLRAWRERALLTQEELGRRAGLDPRTLRRWESGASARPHGSSLRRVAEILELDADEATVLAAVARGAVPPAPVVLPDRPHQLPPAASHFVGRGEELAELLAHAAPGRSVIAVEGMAGVGKTAFAVQAGRLLAADFPDGQLFVDLHGFSDRTRPVGPAEALARLIRALNVPSDELPVDVEECAGLFRSLVAGRRLLLVYDNVGTVDQVAPLLPATGACQVITTSRHTLAGLNRDATLRLDILSRSEAAELFVRASETTGAPDSALLTEAVELCGRLPLALRIAAARLRSRPSWRLADLVGRLREQRAAVLDRQDDQTPGVSAALDLSYAALDEATRRAYRLVGLAPGPDLDAAAAAALLGSGLGTADAALENLQDLHLLDEDPPGRYRLHDLTRTHAARRGRADDTAVERTAALTRLLQHHCAWASAAMDLAHPYTRSRRPVPPYAVSPSWTAEQATSWLDDRLPNLLAGARTAAELGLHRQVVDLAAIVQRQLIMRHRIAEADVLNRLALRAAEVLGDRAAAAGAHRDLGRVRRHQLDFGAAARQFEDALSLAVAERLTLVEIDARIELASMVQYGAAAVDPDEHFTRALRLAEEAGDELGLLESHYLIAHARLGRGAYRSAADHFDQTLTLAGRVGHRSGQVDALIGRGRAEARLGLLDSAVDAFRRAVVLARREDLPVGELAALASLADAVRRSGDPSSALDCYRDALAVAQRTGNQNWQYESLLGLGRACVDLGAGGPAVEHFRQARRLAERVPVRADLVRVEDGLGDACAVLGDRTPARRHWRAALALLTDLGVDHTDDPETNRESLTGKLAAAGS
ncbi:ATP-binding protein [Microlunatus parietis]|uniref:Transcriptional regulator with XRE-family HTH domain n=1 Tax=Microlunatus parietis TaxID=682979 RepID=A0A7Y9LDX0_9ACTN|nr:helix-turn-helix domain-containing protein [Microlunatus parietis]NYE72421.1 transcriptional regulator with XRE-family HTH domain [Microlunatus parietis]